MSMTKTVVGDFWGGYCPDCLKVETEMFLNAQGHWECPSCHLQVKVRDTIVVLAEGGDGSPAHCGHSRIFVSDFLPPQFGKIACDLR